MKPEWLEKIQERAENDLTRWRGDVKPLLSHIEKLREALESLDHGKKCCPDRLPCHVCKTVRKALLHDPMKGVE